MKILSTLVKMQLKEKLNVNRLPKDTKRIVKPLLSLLLFAAKFAVTTALCAAALFAAGLLPLFEDMGKVPDTFISLIFSLMLFFSVCSCTAGLTKSMYFSKDNPVLLTLPASPLQVYLSKLIVFFIFELKKNFSFLVPLFVAYFITHGHSFIFYPWLLVCFVLVSVFTVSLGALLSIPAMWFATIFRQNKSLQGIATLLAVISAFIALSYAVSLIPEDLNLRTNWDYVFLKIQEFLSAYAEDFSLLYEIALMIVGESVISGSTLITVLPLFATFLRFVILICTSASLLATGLIIVKPFFYSMASKPFEYLKKQVKPKKNITLSSSISPIYNEFLKSCKDTAKLSSNIGIMIAIPILIFLLNSLFLAMNTDSFGDSMIITFNLLIILLVSLNANSYAASIYSRDGRAAYLIKAQPKDPTPLLIAKLLPTTAFCIISFLMTFVILTETTNLAIGDCICLMLGVLFIYLAHLLYSAELDIMNPHTEIYAAMGEYGNDPNELKSTAVAFIASFFVSGISLLLIIGGENSVYLKLFIVGLLVFIYRAKVFFSCIRLYYKER